MNLFVTCMTCAKEGKPIPIAVVNYNDEGRYNLECQNGHSTLVVLQNQKFEVLYEIGANAILDGYYREADASIPSFSVASPCAGARLRGRHLDFWPLFKCSARPLDGPPPHTLFRDPLDPHPTT